ncbi:MAG: nitroreductase family protein [Alphaproteobacteria bacterium]|nr:nitroreductase family protein [Alphaproteobacteria bacterium]
MNMFDAIKTRRAVKSFNAQFVMPEADEQQLFELVRHAPTSFNIQNWRFVNVKDKALREELKAAAWGQAQMTDASLLVILCADLKAWEKSPERYWVDAPQAVRDYLVPMIGQFYKGREQVQRDEAMRSVGIAAQTLMLSAKALDYDSCPMIGFDADVVGKLINLPADHVIGMIVTIGKAAKPAQAKGGFIPQAEVVIENTF